MFILLAAAVALTPASRLQRDAEDKARADVTDLFRTLCPEQCVLLSLQARVEEEPIGTADPGFDAPGDLKAPVLKGASTTVLLDQRLPPAFRGKVRDLVTQRLGALGVPAQVAVQAVPFPVRNPPHLEASPPPPQAAPPSLPAPVPAAAQPETKPPALHDRLLEEAPALAAAALFALVALLLGALLYFAARRSQQQAYDLEPAPAQEAAGAGRPAAFPESRRRKLEKAVAEERAVRNAVVREALSRGEIDLVARWVRELGELVLQDLGADRDVAQAVAAVAAQVGRIEPDPASLAELEGRLIGARLARAAENADGAFAFLEGVRPDAFAAACRDLSPGALDAVVRFAPSRLRAAALQELSTEQRRELALALARRPEVPASYALAAADELRERLEGIGGGPRQAEIAMSDLIDSLGRDEQDALVERLRRESDGRSLRALVTESALGGVPAEVLTSVLLRVDPGRVVSYLAGADPALRDKVLARCPARFRREIEEELRLRGDTAPAEFLEARREILARLREETARRNISPAEVRGWSNGAAERARLAME
jgi:flagellar motor switch protein FliG